MFTCLSHDAIVHTTLHAVLAGLRPDLMEAPDDPRFRDVYALQEGLCDMSALLLHFSYREAVLDTIRHTAGAIYRSRLDADVASAVERPLLQAELAAGNPLLVMGQGFGEGLGMDGGIRNALGSAPDPAAFNRANEPHERGAFLVAAFFDAFFSIYVRRTRDLFAIYRVGGGRIDGDMPDTLAERLFIEAEVIAARMFTICVRALDYCPVGPVTFGDFLRACITVDYDASPGDDDGVRDALMQAFRAARYRAEQHAVLFG